MTRIWIAVLLLLPASSYAAEPLRAAQAMQVVSGLAVVLGLIALVSWFARRMPGVRGGQGARLRVLEGLPLGTRDKLLLVEVDGQRVLLGMSPGRIQPLATLHDEDGIRTPAAAATGSDFQQALNASFGADQ